MSSQLKPWLLLSVIFIVGVVTGAALTVGLGPHFMHPLGEQQVKLHLMAHLTNRLKLTADQQAKIRPILADAATKIQALQRDEVERGSQIFKAINDQILPYLTPEQKVELQKMETEREKMFSGHMRPWGPPHQVPGGPFRDGPGGMYHHGGLDDGAMPPPPVPNEPTNAAPPANP